MGELPARPFFEFELGLFSTVLEKSLPEIGRHVSNRRIIIHISIISVISVIIVLVLLALVALVVLVLVALAV